MSPVHLEPLVPLHFVVDDYSFWRNDDLKIFVHMNYRDTFRDKPIARNKTKEVKHFECCNLLIIDVARFTRITKNLLTRIYTWPRIIEIYALIPIFSLLDPTP